MKKAVFPGSFDPITNGHLDIIERAAKHFDEFHVVVADNISKSGLFTPEERIDMIKLVTKHIPNLVIVHTNELVVRYARNNGANIIIRGLRNINDYISEYDLYNFNKNLDGNIETMVMFPSSGTHFISSSAIKELIHHDANISPYVPKELVKIIIEKYTNSIK